MDIALVAMLGGLCVANGNNDALKLNSVPGVPPGRGELARLQVG